MSNLTQGRPAQNLLYGALLILLGAAGFYFSTWGNWTLAIRNLALPQWTMQGLALLAFAGGLALLIFSKETVCGLCGHPMQNDTACFKTEQKDAVMNAFNQGHFSAIFALPWAGLGDAEVHSWNGRLEADIYLCSNCAQSGYMLLEHYDGSTTSELGKREFTKEEAKALEATMDEHFPEDGD